MNSNPIQLRILRSFEEAAGLQRAWDDFAEHHEAEIFLTYDWLRIWWNHYHRGRAMMILVFELNGKLAGILPLCRDVIGRGPWRMRVWRTLGTDFTPVTVSLLVDPAALIAVVDAFMQFFQRQNDWDLLFLGPSAGKCRLTRIFYEAIRLHAASHTGARLDPGGEQIYFHLHANWEQQLASLSSRERSRMRAVYRKLEKARIPLKAVWAEERNSPVLFDEFVHAHQARWNAIGHGGHFKDWPGALDFHRDIVRAHSENGRLRLLSVCLDDRPIGYKYEFKTGSGYYDYLDAHCADFTGLDLDVYRLNFRALVERAMAEGVRWIDSMRGRYEHKLHIGGEIKASHRLFMTSASRTSRARVMLWRSMATLRDLVYYKLWRRRLALRLHIRPAPLSEPWIRTAALSYWS